MNNEFSMLQDILEGAKGKFDIAKKVLRFSLINNDSDFVFSEFYNFENNKEIISFLKNVVIPSTAISILTEDNGKLVITIEEENEFLEQLEDFGAEDQLIEKCKDMYKRLDKINIEDNKKLHDIIEFINFEFSEGHMIMLSVEYANNTEAYLKNMYQEYKTMKQLDTLEKELANINLCMGGFKDIFQNIEKYKDEVKEKLLDRLPY